MAKPIFISIRGNSGSGKTAIATELQKYFGYRKCLLLHEDLLRIEILHAKEVKDAPTAEMIKLMVDLGMRNYQVVILEGILPRKIYGSMLEEFKKKYRQGAYFYYLDVPFEKTLGYNNQKGWLNNDCLGTYECKIQGERIGDYSEQILTDISRKMVDKNL